MKLGSALIDLLQSYDSGMVCCLVGLPHDVYLSEDVLPAGLPSSAFLENLGGILLSTAFVSTPLHYGEFPPVDIANVNATAYIRSAVYQTVRVKQTHATIIGAMQGGIFKNQLDKSCKQAKAY